MSAAAEVVVVWAARPSRTRASGGCKGIPGIDGGPDFEVSPEAFAPFRTDGSEAAPPHLGARCRSQIARGASVPGANSGKSFRDTRTHPQPVASLRRWQEQAVVRERLALKVNTIQFSPPNAPPQNRAGAPRAASPGTWSRGRRPSSVRPPTCSAAPLVCSCRHLGLTSRRMCGRCSSGANHAGVRARENTW